MFEFKGIGQFQRQRFRLRVGVALLVTLLGLGVLGWRFWFLQVERHEGLAARADRNRLAIVPLPPRRGDILDRNGEVLARNYRTYTLEVVPAHAGDIDELLQKLSPVVYISPVEQRRFLRRVQESGRYARIPLRTSLNDTEAAWFAVNGWQFPGVNLHARWVREYPHGEVAGHVLGYIGRIDDKDVEWLEETDQLGNYRGSDVIGKKGVEKTWESSLHGQTGFEEVEVTATGRPVRTLRRVDPEPGKDLMLSIDLGLQQMAEGLFAGRRGALVAIEPETGEVLAFVSQPSFDPNLFVDGIDVENWKQLRDSPDHPLLNRPLYGTYPIGSTYKPFVALAALELGKRRATDRFYDPGFFEFAGQRFRNAGSAAYGSIDLNRALAVSSDTYFYALGPDIGVDALHDFMQPFGFGQLTGIDLDGERRGILPSTDWKRNYYREREQQRWYTGETISVMVGQGYNAFTLLQLAHATSVLANDGVVMKPHLVRAVREAGQDIEKDVVTEPTNIIPLQQANLDAVKQAMVAVTQTGTARRAFAGTPYSVAGKTGTAQVFSLRGGQYRASQIDERLRDHALFMAFAPAEKPKIALALIVENAGWGASIAAPLARQVFDYWLARPEHAAPAAVLDRAAAASDVDVVRASARSQASAAATSAGTQAEEAL
ncbi:penicillin-binding protein 2 [Alcaligenaceae bacterium SJ-26]|nr:penicillin-binding protein 2 [Alcaligenaceae bacterium SJ-26]